MPILDSSSCTSSRLNKWTR